MGGAVVTAAFPFPGVNACTNVEQWPVAVA